MDLRFPSEISCSLSMPVNRQVSLTSIDIRYSAALASAAMTENIRNATKAAQLLGIEVPEEYSKFGGNGRNGERPQGKFYWEAKGHMPFRADVSRAMWRLSPGSGGSVGKRGEGALSSEEFWALVRLDESKVQVGEKNSATLPNGKEVGFQRVE